MLKLLLLLALTVASSTAASSDEWVGIIDAGSTGSRIYLYSYPERESSSSRGPLSVPKISQGAHKLKNHKPLASYASHPQDAGDSVAELFAHARDVVPKAKWSETPVYLMATAGMRLLPAAQREPVLENVREFMKASAFKYDGPEQVRVISGEEEGTFGWLSVNFLLGTFMPDKVAAGESFGAMDLGGASTQITFSTPNTILANYFPIRLVGEIIPLYTHSYLRYGANEMRYRQYDDVIEQDPSKKQHNFPCLADGYTEEYQSSKWSHNGDNNYTLVGTSDPVACNTSTYTLFDFDPDLCTTETCSFNGVYQPPIEGFKFYAFATFSHLATEIGITDTLTLAHILERSEQICAMDEAELSGNFTSPYRYEFCSELTYMVALLHSGYGFALDSTSITFPENDALAGQDLGWALGAAIHVMNLLPWDIPRGSDDDCTSLMATTIGVSALLVLALVLLWHQYRMRKREASWNNPFLNERLRISEEEHV